MNKLRHGRSRRRGQREERLFFKNVKRRGWGLKQSPKGKGRGRSQVGSWYVY
jgi:hypothetical protein